MHALNTTLSIRFLLVGLLAAALLLSGCAEDSCELEICGNYTDDFGGTHRITDTTWDSSGDGFTLVFNIIEIDNSQNYIVAQNDAANSFNAGLFSRFAWTVFGGDLFFCQDPFDADSADAARSAPFPNSSNPPGGGCGSLDFSWSRLIPVIEVVADSGADYP